MVDHVHADLVRALDTSGTPASGAYLETYLSGTSTPATVYSDTAASVAHAWPVLSGQNGAAAGVFPPIYSTGIALKVRCYDADDTLLYELDPVPSISISSSAAADISFSPYTGFAQTNVQAALEAIMALWNAVTSWGRTFLTSASASAARTELGLGDIATADITDLSADQATWNTGTSTTESLITPAKLEAKFSDWLSDREFTSGALSFPSADVVSAAHGLSAVPKELEAWMVNTTTELGYAVGTVVGLGASRDGDGARNYTVYADATNIYFSKDAASLFIGDASGAHDGTAIDTAKWSLYLRGRL